MKRRLVRSVASATAILVALLLTFTPARAQTINVSNSATIGLTNSAQASPYPSIITSCGKLGTITSVEATISGLWHFFLTDLDILLVGPTGASTILMSDISGSVNFADAVTLTFKDSATNSLPSSGSPTSGDYKPTNYGTGDTFVAPAPGGPYGSTLAAFNGTNPNGIWSLYILNDNPGIAGQIVNGWSLRIETVGTTVQKCAPSIQANPVTVTYGGTANVSATLSLGTTGLSGKTVTFTRTIGASTTTLGTATTNASGVATLSGASFAGVNAGGYPGAITASFAGDTDYSAVSDTDDLTVNQAATTAAITSDNPDPSVVGQSVTVVYSVTSSAGTPTGNVTVSDGTASCTASVAAGQCTVTFTSAGAKTLTATYAGDTNFGGSTSAGTAHTVNKANTTAAITSDNPDPSVVGQNVTVAYTVTVTAPGAGTPAGNVTVSDGTASCTASVAAGQCTLAFASVGAKTLTATYAGNSNFNGSTSAGVSHTVNKANTTTAITSDNPDPSIIGQTVTVAYSVTANSPGAGTPTGNVTVSDGTVSCTASVAAGQCTVTFTGLGTKSLTATYAGDSNFNGSTSASESHAVNKISTTTTISSDNPDPSVVGQGITVVYSVGVVAPGTGTPTGSVMVSDGAGASCTATVAAGQCVLFSTSAGARTLTATYAGDTDFNGSSSAGTAHTVNKAATTVGSLTDAPGPSVVGQTVTIGYVVSVTAPGAGTPTGTVTASVGGDSCTGTVAAGQCTLTFTSAGTKTVTVTYNGDANFNTGSNTLGHLVNQANTTTTITSDNPDPSVIGESVTVAYSVAVSGPGAGTPTGNVTVSDGVNSCTASVAAGQCSLALTTLGARTLTATYAGDSNFNGSTSANEPHTVNQAGTTTTITSDNPDPSAVGQTITVAYSVAVSSPGAGTPTGSVTVSDGAISCVASVAAGQCTLTFTSAGARTLTATYAGDANFNGSTSAGVAHTVNKANTTTAITADPTDPSLVGQSITVSYSVAVSSPGAGTPTGTVTVGDGVNSCTGSVAAGQCSLTLLTAGARTLTATYAGDSNFNGSTSANEPHTVNKIGTTTTITGDASDPSVVGEAVTVQFTVSAAVPGPAATVQFTVSAAVPGPAAPTGSVTVSDGAISCVASVAAGQCSLTFTSPGPRTLTATYAGDSNFVGSAAANEPHTVNQAATTTTITADNPDPSVVGQTVTVQFAVAVVAPGAGTPTGTVTVSDGAISCSGTVAAGQCTLTFTGAGGKSLTATYAGDSNFAGSASATEPHTVNQAATTTTITADTPDPTVTGQPVTVAYSVAVSSPGAGTPTGTVTVSDGTASCTATVAAGQCALAPTSVGAKTLVATYAGDADFAGSASAGTAHTVNQAATTVAIVADNPDPSVQGQAVTVQYAVAVVAPGGGAPTGNVTVGDGVDSCTGTAAAGQCAITFSTIGARTLVATYAGDANYGGSTAASEPHTVLPPAAIVAVPTATASYGDASVTLTATVTNPLGGSIAGGTVTFTVRKGGTVRAVITSGPVNGPSPATASVILPLGATWDAGSYAIEASYAGDAGLRPGTGTGTLTIQRRILWLKPIDRTVVLYQPNPPATAPTNCLAQATATRACWLELLNGSTFAYGQSWSNLNLANLRFGYARSYPSSNTTEYVGKTYRISAAGVVSSNYDIRYATGTLTVVAGP